MLGIKPLKGLKGLPGLKGLGKRERIPPLPTLGQQPGRVAALEDDEVQRLTRQLGDEAVAKRLLKLKKKWPDGTTPELIVMDFLERRREKYQFQMWVLGGRKIKGGAVLDFVIDNGRSVIVVWVQGDYWHKRARRRQADEAQMLAVRGLQIWGKRVSSTISVWESRIASDNRAQRRQTLEAMLTGRELGV